MFNGLDKIVGKLYFKLEINNSFQKSSTVVATAKMAYMLINQQNFDIHIQSLFIQVEENIEKYELFSESL